MFLATDWVLDEAHKVGNENLTAVYPKVPGANNYKSIIMRRFDFSSALQRMSVICENHIDG
jgi:magnesium-transporting ATPase (P-type)